MANFIKNARVALAYPHGGSVRHCFMDSVVNFREYDIRNGTILGARIPAQGLYVDSLRNQIVRDFLKLPEQIQWLMMIDTDQVFTPDQPQALLEAAEERGAKIMSALYFGVLNGQLAPMWWNKISTGEYGTAATIVEGVQEIDAFGCGMCLIHRSVLEEMAPHYPDDPWKWFGRDLVKFNGHMDRFGEDLCFCDRVNKLGIAKIYGDSRVVIGHDKSRIIDLATFLREAKPREEGEPVAVSMLDQTGA